LNEKQQMQAEAQRGQVSRPGNRIRRLGRADHQAYRGENALTVCALDCVVDLARRRNRLR